ncbi:helix-turn-helix domain-containing protein [Pseudomonas sp. Fl5BN2]|uniref:GlxA family transcriptional regulator n=1 Tax=unclassified Pseudomonas TaxID=196821 RepID=UPI00137669AA|nr:MULTISPECIES: helix-turn-helix domain-containing protein [unclassified Pseudomonas]NBF05947.1 helix-turn-helix domain-containing protein [Pseudomonas sp. Fl5BN2]NBF10835.1 helix-turn-helix domain-containing protein [Pseudomonas sp. Fl4BN1]
MNDFTVLLLPGAFASSVALTLDILSTAALLAPRLGLGAPRWRVCALQGGQVSLGQGLLLEVEALGDGAADRSCWILPGLGIDVPEAIEQRLQQADIAPLLSVLRRHVQEGGEVAASCSAVFLLHAADLIRGRRVTTSWWLAPLLQERARDSHVDPDQMLIVDTPLTTAGAALGQSDLLLHLLRSRFSPALADAVGQVLLIDRRQLQAPYAVPAMMAQGNVLIGRIIAHIETCLPRLPSVGELAAQFGMSERTLARQVRKATGHSSLRLIHSVQLNRARGLLQNSKYSVENIAEQVGYQDATALRRLMRKMLNATPRQLR